MKAKSFAVGVRMEHPQELIDSNQYGRAYGSVLPAADYKVTRKLENGKGVYSFCMCPGGYVVNASSEEEMLAVNGMSYHSRAGRNANSAMVVTVGPEDFGSDAILAGMEFQRKLERAAFQAGEGKIPVQLFGDFLKNRKSQTLGEVEPQNKGQWQFGDVRGIFPEYLAASLAEGFLPVST
ncbi:MAG: NAD(P)/FAD-dependent oxidoreductase [Blautia sp.]